MSFQSQQDVLVEALKLAQQKVRLFQVKWKQKTPAINNFSTRASHSESILKNYFSAGNFNSGIACGEVSSGLYLVGFDIDSKKGKNGYETLIALEQNGFQLPPTWTQKTPSGGEHRLFWSSTPIRQGTDVIGNGIDLRGDGGYLVGPGSLLENGSYVVTSDLPIASFPKWAVEMTSRPLQRAPQINLIADPDESLAAQLSAKYLEQLKTAEEGSRNDSCFRAAARLKEFGLSKAPASSLMLEKWKCEGEFSDEEIITVIESVYKSRKIQFGGANPAAIFTDLSEEPSKLKIKEHIEELNNDYFVSQEAGKVTIYRKCEDHLLQRQVLHRIDFADFKKMFANRPVVPGRALTIAEDWIKDPSRRQFLGGVIFDPNGNHPSNCFNLWSGFSIQPTPGDWGLLKNFITEVLCSNNEELEKYLIGWMANMFQRPGEPGQVALVFQGEKGTGKTTFNSFLLRIMGQHGLEVAQSSLLTGRFTGHFRDAVFVHAEEAYWSGDKAAEAFLKALITNRTLTLEGKFQSPTTVRNVTHLTMSTNNDWAVPASLSDERRFAIFKISSKYQKNSEYFKTLRLHAEEGGLAAMLHDLLRFDLKEFDVTKAPENEELSNQKILSLRGPERWLFDSLNSGKFLGSFYSWDEETNEILKDEIFCGYQHYARREFFQMNKTHWGRMMRKYFPGSLIIDTRPEGKRCWRIAPLSMCRESFAKINRLSGPIWADSENSDEDNSTYKQIRREDSIDDLL